MIVAGREVAANLSSTSRDEAPRTASGGDSVHCTLMIPFFIHCREKIITSRRLQRRLHLIVPIT